MNVLPFGPVCKRPDLLVARMDTLSAPPVSSIGDVKFIRCPASISIFVLNTYNQMKRCFRFLFSLLFSSVWWLYRFIITPYKLIYFLLKHIRHYGTKEDLGLLQEVMIFCWKLLKAKSWQRQYLSEKVVKKFAIV